MRLAAGGTHASGAAFADCHLGVQQQEGVLAVPLELDPPILTYFEATNAHQADAVAELFAGDGLVHDEGHDHVGRKAIRDWAEGTYRKYGVALVPLGAQSDGEATLVTSEVSGTFPNSPIELRFRFVTDGDQISELRIG